MLWHKVTAGDDNFQNMFSHKISILIEIPFNGILWVSNEYLYRCCDVTKLALSWQLVIFSVISDKSLIELTQMSDKSLSKPMAILVTENKCPNKTLAKVTVIFTIIIFKYMHIIAIKNISIKIHWEIWPSWCYQWEVNTLMFGSSTTPWSIKKKNPS